MGESPALVQQLVEEAASVTPPPIAERPITAVKGAGTRDNWKAELVDKRALILHVAERLRTQDDSLLNLLDVNVTTAEPVGQAQGRRESACTPSTTSRSRSGECNGSTYACPTCQSRTTIEEGDAPLCVPCHETMVLTGATIPGEPEAGTLDAVPIAPENVAAYRDGLAEIETAKANADTQEREYLRAKEYVRKAKKRLEAAEATLRATVQAVADRLRPRPLFDEPDRHSAEELVALLADAGVDVTAAVVRQWTDAERADARAYALAQHSEQPRLIPPFWRPRTIPTNPLTRKQRMHRRRPNRELHHADLAGHHQQAGGGGAASDASSAGRVRRVREDPGRHREHGTVMAAQMPETQ
jgi:hypothetical protein